MKTCLTCNKDILQKVGESNYKYNRKKFCSQECCRAYMRENKLGWYATAKVAAKLPRHSWDDLDVAPYLSDDDLDWKGGR